MLLRPQGGSLPGHEHPMPTAALRLLNADALTSAERISAEGCHSSWDGHTCAQAKATLTMPEGTNRAPGGVLLCGETSNSACPSSSRSGHLQHESADNLFKAEKSGTLKPSCSVHIPRFPSWISYTHVLLRGIYSSATSHSPIPTPAEVCGSNPSCLLSALGQASVSKGQSQLKISKQATEFCLVLPFKYNFSSV